MSQFSRRSLLAAMGTALATPAFAQNAAPVVLRAPGFAAWTPPAWPRRVPLDVPVTANGVQKQLRDWIGHRPAVLALWASWCGPCLREKPAQAALTQRLAAAHASAQIFALQAYDQESFERAEHMLDRLGAGAMIAARASPAAEAAFIRVFGASPRDPRRVSLPSVLLVSADGMELGRMVGTQTAPDGATDYWAADSTFDFLSHL